MHPKVEVTQVEDAASAAAASGASESNSFSFLDSDLAVMIGGILAGGILSFAAFLVVGFVCVQVRRRGSNHGHCPTANSSTNNLVAIGQNGSNASSTVSQTKMAMQVGLISNHR